MKNYKLKLNTDREDAPNLAVEIDSLDEPEISVRATIHSPNYRVECDITLTPQKKRPDGMAIIEVLKKFGYLIWNIIAFLWGKI